MKSRVDPLTTQEIHVVGTGYSWDVQAEHHTRTGRVSVNTRLGSAGGVVYTRIRGKAGEGSLLEVSEAVREFIDGTALESEEELTEKEVTEILKRRGFL